MPPQKHGMIYNNWALISSFLRKNQIDIPWYNSLVWEDLTLRENINDLTSQLNKMNFIMVSEPSKLNLPFLTGFIEVPLINCFFF